MALSHRLPHLSKPVAKCAAHVSRFKFADTAIASTHERAMVEDMLYFIGFHTTTRTVDVMRR